MWQRSRLQWMLLPLAGTGLALATVSVLAFFADAPPVGSNTLTRANWCDGPGSSTVTATADTWVDQAAPTAVNGTATTVIVQSRNSAARRSLVTFTLPTLPAGCSVTAATLRLYNQTPAAGRTIDVYRAAAAWVAFMRELAMGPVDLAPRLSQAQDRGPFPVQQRVHRTVRTGPGVCQAVVQSAGGPAQQPGVVDPQEGSGAS